MSARIVRLFGLYLIAVAIAVGVQFTVEFLYESAPITPARIWFILDWFSLVGVRGMHRRELSLQRICS